MRIQRMREQKHFVSGLVDLVNYINKDGLIVVELGSYKGDSAEIFLGTGKIDKLYCIDIWEPFKAATKINGSYMREEMHEVEKMFDSKFSKNNKVAKIKSKSVEGVPYVKEMVDVVYIDALHSYEGVKQDIKAWESKIKKGGFLTGHDYCKQFEGVMQAVNEYAKENNKEIKTFCDTSWAIQL